MSLLREEVVRLHDPSCSRSRALKAALDQRGVEHVERRCSDEPPDRSQLEDLIARLGDSPRDVVRRMESAHRETGLSDDADDADDARVLDAIARDPVLLALK